MLELVVHRKILTPKCTVGELTIKGYLPVWYTLEDVDRDRNRDGDLNDPGEKKVWGETAIPSGLYNIKWQFSNHFKETMPYLDNVPNFSGVMIHPGNRIEHTHGCLLVGTELHKVSDELYEVRNSKAAFKHLIGILSNEKGGFHDATINVVYG